MPSVGRLPAVVFLVFLVLSSLATAQGPLRPSRKPPPASGAPSAPAAPGPLPVLRLGALLPLTGPGAWFGEELHHGMELAAADLNPPPARRAPPAVTATDQSGTKTPQSGTKTPETKTSDTKTPETKASEAKASETAAPPTEPAEAREGQPAATLQIVVEATDVQPLDVKEAAAQFGRLATTGAPVVFTASPTPTLTIYPLAAARDILVVHQGLPSDRFPAQSRTLLQMRPSAVARGETLAAYAWERGLKQVALLAAGDEFGRTVRRSLTARWRALGGTLAHEESLSLEAPDLTARLTRLARLAPEAVCLAFRGEDLGELARRLRQVGYAGLLLLLDDDPTVLLAAGPTLTDALILTDAFVSTPDTPGARFARAYQAKFGRAPSRYAAIAYDAVTIIAAGARLALEEGRGLPGGARLRETLLKQRTFPSIYGGVAVLRDDGTLEQPLALLSIERGRAAFVRYVTPAGRPVLEGRELPAGPAQPALAALQPCYEGTSEVQRLIIARQFLRESAGPA